MTKTTMTDRKRMRSVRWTGFVALLTVLALVAAACGDDDDAAPTPAPAPAEEPAAPEEPAAEEPAAEEPAAEEPAAEEPAAEELAGEPAAEEPAAPEDPYLALCPADEAPDKMVLSIWGGHQNDIGEAVLQFTDLTGVEIEYLENGTGDRITKLNVEKGGPTIDIAIVPVNEVPALLANEVILPEDPSVPNYDTLIDLAKVSGGYGTSLLDIIIAYNPEFIPEPPTSWLDLLDPAYAGHVQLATVPSVTGYAALAIINELLGGPPDSVSTAIDAIAERRDGIFDIYGFAPANYPLVEDGTIWIYPEISGVIQQFIDAGGPLEIAVPEEGGAAGMNVAVIPVGVPSEGCAKAFVGWFLGAEVQTAYAVNRYYATVNGAVDLPADVVANIYPTDPDDLYVVDWDFFAENAVEILDEWNRKVMG